MNTKHIKLLVAVLLLFNSIVHSQELTEKKVETNVSDVTVFLDGAQITRKKQIDIPKGTSILKFTKLSPFIDAKSVQVKADGKITILSVNHQLNFLDSLKKSDEIKALEEELNLLFEKIKNEEMYLSIIMEELQFLNDNRDIGGKSQEVSVSNWKEASDFYHNKLTSLKLDEIKRRKTVEDLRKEQIKIRNQMNTISNKKEFASGEILVKVDAKSPVKAAFELNYLVENAGWFPSYDIRANDITQPINLVYKANVHQDTKVDWDNVNLTFSTSEPKKSNVAPQLQTFFLGYNTRPPVYKNFSGQLTGKVTSAQDGLPLPGVNVMIKGTTIGTVTDMTGNFSLTTPEDAQTLVFSFVGFLTEEIPISGSRIDLTMTEDIQSLDEVVVIGYGTRKKMNLTGAVSELDFSDNNLVYEYEESPKVKVRGTSSIPLETVKVENQTNVEFEIKMPYTIKSSNKNTSVDMAHYNIDAEYEYYCVPKIDPSAFLLANITNWQQYNLLEGEANVFFEETYIGKTILDVRYVSDTINISLGRDKSVIVKREKIDDFTTKQFIGNKKEENIGWKILVRNNKSHDIKMTLKDQIPVSTLEEIEIEVNKISEKGRLDEETGVITWDLDIPSSKQKEAELKYSVKYPKYRNLIIE